MPDWCPVSGEEFPNTPAMESHLWTAQRASMPRSEDFGDVAPPSNRHPDADLTGRVGPGLITNVITAYPLRIYVIAEAGD